MISKTASFNMKGLACIGIALHHYFHQAEIPVQFLAWFVSLWGTTLVACFFFLSGYGLTQSFGDKRPSCALFFKRIVRILVPLAVIHLTLYFPLLKLNLMEPLRGAKAIIGYLFFDTENHFLWFIKAILVMYLFFFISSIPKSKNVRIIICFLLILTYGIFAKYVLKYGSVQYANNFPFLLGCIIAMYESQIKKAIFDIRMPRLVIASITISGILFLAFQFLRNSVLDDVSCMCLGFCMIPTVLLLNYLRCFEYRSFAFLGACSFELYIIHWWILSLMKSEGYLTLSPLSILLFTGSCLLMAYIFSIINRYPIAKYDALTKSGKNSKIHS